MSGNNVLQMHRAFWFAAVHGIPDSGVSCTRKEKGE